MEKRIAQLREVLQRNQARAMVVSDVNNIRYFSGFTGEGCLLIAEGEAVLLTDSRYSEQASKQAPLYRVEEIDQTGLYALCARLLAALGDCRVLIEADVLSVSQKKLLQQALQHVQLVDTEGIGAQIRACKDARELQIIRRAGEITEDCLQHVYRIARVGMTELELAAELSYYMARTHGCEPAFAHIVASGVNGSMPHAIPTDKPFAAGELITLDFGAKYQGYCSDMTRTFALGQPQGVLCEIYEIVREAQARAQTALAPGKTGCELDAIAREYIASHGYGARFGHGLGHGVGIEIHEQPRLSRLSQTKLRPGMVVTVEPGIYLPGVGGVRIENTCVITENSHESIFKATTDMVLL